MTDPVHSAPMRPPSAPRGAPQDRDDRLRAAAVQLETEFLAEMLKAAGAGKPREAFGGGAGEEQFASFLVRAQAEGMAKAGGLGLADALYASLKARADGR